MQKLQKLCYNAIMKKIKLTQNKYALVDNDDYDMISKNKWCVTTCGTKFYAVHSIPTLNGKRTPEYMHHIIIGKPLKGHVTDHINGNGLDNRKCNLRLVTYRQNQQNRHHKKSSKYPGVQWHKCDKRWFSCIRFNGKRTYLGYFINEKKAYQAYQDACKKLLII
jgi:hypothetical protein